MPGNRRAGLAGLCHLDQLPPAGARYGSKPDSVVRMRSTDSRKVHSVPYFSRSATVPVAPFFKYLSYHPR